MVVAHACGSESVKCLLEVHHTFLSHAQQTLLNLGTRIKLAESVTFLSAIGRDFGGPKDDRRSTLIYAGLQFNH